MPTLTKKITFVKTKREINKLLEQVISLKDTVDFFDLENKKDFYCNVDSIEAYLRELKMIASRDEEYRRVTKFLSK